MRELEEDLSVYAGVEIPDAMRGDPLRNPALAELDCSPGPSRLAALQSYQLVHDLYSASQQQDFIIHPGVVVRAYELVHDRQRGKARSFNLLHVLLRGIYAQLRCEQEEDFGAKYQTICGTNRLIDETIQWMHSQRPSR